jgi:hypothetical protein
METQKIFLIFQDLKLLPLLISAVVLDTKTLLSDCSSSASSSRFMSAFRIAGGSFVGPMMILSIKLGTVIP